MIFHLQYSRGAKKLTFRSNSMVDELPFPVVNSPIWTSEKSR